MKHVLFAALGIVIGFVLGGIRPRMQLAALQVELTEARARAGQLRRTLALVDEELALKTPLVEKGLVTKVEFLQLQKQQNETRGELEAVRLSIPRIESTIEEAKRKRNLLIAKQKRAQAQKRIHETMSGLSDTSAFEAFNRMNQLDLCFRW